MSDEKVSFNSNGEYTFVSGVKKMDSLGHSDVNLSTKEDKQAAASSQGLNLNLLRKNKKKPATSSNSESGQSSVAKEKKRKKPATSSNNKSGRSSATKEKNQKEADEIVLDSSMLLKEAEEKLKQASVKKHTGSSTALQHMSLDTPVDKEPDIHNSNEEVTEMESVSNDTVVAPTPDLDLSLNSLTSEVEVPEEVTSPTRQEKEELKDFSMSKLNQDSDVQIPVVPASEKQEESNVESVGGESGTMAFTAPSAENHLKEDLQAGSSSFSNSVDTGINLHQIDFADKKEEVSKPSPEVKSESHVGETNGEVPVQETKFKVVSAEDILSKPYGGKSLSNTPKFVLDWVIRVGREFVKHPVCAFECAKAEGIKAYVMFFLSDRRGNDQLCICIGKNDSFTAVTYDSDKKCLVDVADKLSIQDDYVVSADRVLITSGTMTRRTLTV